MAIFVKHTKVSAVPDDADTSLVRPSDWNADHALTGFGTAAEKDAGVANGVATLDGTGKVPISELPSAVLGALNYQGTWDASTNTPTLTSSVGTKGYYYVVNVAGTTNLNGITDWQIGDWAVFNGTAWEKVDNTDAGGDVVGPSSATDNAIARYDGTTGRVIQNSIVTVSDTGDIAGATTITDINYVDFNTAYATTLGVGQLGWDGNNTLGLGMAGGNVIQHIGEDQFFYCKATSAITKGQVVMFTGAVGASGVPTGAPATGITDGSYIMGIAAENIANNGFGLVQAFGTLRNVNTNSFADGDILWYNPAVTGGLTNVKPSAPNVKVQMAAVINGGSTGGGTILIRINAGSTLGGTDSNAQIGTPSNGQIITYDGQDLYWRNTTLTAGTAISVSTSATGVLTVANTGVTQATAGTGISVSSGTGNVTITNTAPDQVVSLTGAGTTVVTGTYPNFTITSNDQYVGTVTSVAALTIGTTGTDLSSTVANPTTTPVITLNVPTASATNRGALSSTDWTTFNNKVTSVSGTTGRITSSGGTTPAIDLASGIVTAGTTGSSTLIPVITVDTYGRVTAITTAANPQGTVTSITAGTGLTGGTITTSGTIAIDSTVATLTGNQILTNKTISGANNTLSNIGNSSLTNSSITINGTAVSLGGSITVTASISTLTIGTGLTGTSYNGTSPVTIAIDSTVVVTSGSYANPSWITSLDGSKITGTMDGGSF